MTDPAVDTSEIDASTEGVVQTIIQWRIYDTLLVILDALGGDSTSLARLHEQGVFLGPNPAARPEPAGE